MEGARGVGSTSIALAPAPHSVSSQVVFDLAVPGSATAVHDLLLRAGALQVPRLQGLALPSPRWKQVLVMEAAPDERPSRTPSPPPTRRLSSSSSASSWGGREGGREALGGHSGGGAAHQAAHQRDEPGYRRRDHGDYYGMERSVAPRLGCARALLVLVIFPKEERHQRGSGGAGFDALHREQVRHTADPSHPLLPAGIGDACGDDTQNVDVSYAHSVCEAAAGVQHGRERLVAAAAAAVTAAEGFR